MSQSSSPHFAAYMHFLRLSSALKSSPNFKRLAVLRKRKLVKAVKDGTDVRTKFVLPTPKGIAYISRFAQALTHCSGP